MKSGGFGQGLTSRTTSSGAPGQARGSTAVVLRLGFASLRTTLSKGTRPKAVVRVEGSFPNLKPSSRAISLRLPEPMIVRLKEQANERRVPYQSLIKQYIAEGLKS